jgi:hypothetical protein
MLKDVIECALKDAGVSAERSQPLNWPEEFASKAPTSLPFKTEPTVRVVEVEEPEGIPLEHFLARERRLNAMFRAQHGL